MNLLFVSWSWYFGAHPSLQYISIQKDYLHQYIANITLRIWITTLVRNWDRRCWLVSQLGKDAVSVYQECKYRYFYLYFDAKGLSAPLYSKYYIQKLIKTLVRNWDRCCWLVSQLGKDAVSVYQEFKYRYFCLYFDTKGLSAPIYRKYYT